MSWRIDSQQRRKCNREVYRLRVRAIRPRLKRETIERQGNVRVVAVGRCVVSPLRNPDGERRGNSHHIPSAVRRVTVQIPEANLGVRDVTTRQLCARVVATQTDLQQSSTYTPLADFSVNVVRG